MRILTPASSLALLWTIACAAEGREDGGFGPGAPAPGGGSTSGDDGAPGDDGSGGDGGDGSGGDSGTDDGGDSGGGDGGPKFDIGAAPDLAGNPDGSEGCKKVDFLFVIDNSGSMEEEQQSLVNSFPGFIAEIRAAVAATDFHILVTDSDADAASSGCPGSPGDPAQCANWCASCPPHCSCVCAGNACPPPPAGDCDYVLGAGQIKDQDRNDCGVVGGQRWMTETQPDLEGTFACIALVGTGGDGNERPMEAAEDAVTTLQPAGECNEGFLRDDAILVVTVISDEEDVGKSMGNPATWRDTLVAAKNGDETAVVPLAIVGDTGVPGGVCGGGAAANAEDAPRLRQWAESFTHGQWGSVCAADYTAFFSNAVSVIDTACDDFVPPG